MGAYSEGDLLEDWACLRIYGIENKLTGFELIVLMSLQFGETEEGKDESNKGMLIISSCVTAFLHD